MSGVSAFVDKPGLLFGEKVNCFIFVGVVPRNRDVPLCTEQRELVFPGPELQLTSRVIAKRRTFITRCAILDLNAPRSGRFCGRYLYEPIRLGHYRLLEVSVRM